MVIQLIYLIRILFYPSLAGPKKRGVTYECAMELEKKHASKICVSGAGGKKLEQALREYKKMVNHL